jgi:hypothetical protein
LTVSAAFIIIHAVQGPEENQHGEGWEFGEVWQSGAPEEADTDRDVVYVEVLRGDTGRGFDDTLMLDLVGYLGSRGIRATYDSFSLGLEPAAIKTYVLKVEAGREQEALELLEAKGAGGGEQGP